MLKPQYEAMEVLFRELAQSGTQAGTLDRGVYDTWIQKAPKKGIRIMLENLIDKGPLTFQQLCTLAGAAASTGYEYVGWLKRNQLVDREGESYRLRSV